jgi:general stress protein YciG
MSEKHREAGRKGGQETVRLYGPEHMRAIGHLGGRPSWQEKIEQYRQQNKQALKKVRRKN